MRQTSISNLQTLWEQSRDQHEELVRIGLVHLTGTPRVGSAKTDKTLFNSFEKMDNGFVAVVSSAGLIFVGQTILLRLENLKVVKEVPAHSIVRAGKFETSLSQIARRHRDPLCSLDQQAPSNSKGGGKKKKKAEIA
jgi:hypothetical protein